MATSKDQIFNAADGLVAIGQSPTLAAVRKALGGGSFTTISEAMAEWRARKASREQPLGEPVPVAVTDRLKELGADIWSAALELSNGRLAGERAALDAARAHLEADKTEASDLADMVTVELEAAKAALVQAQTQQGAAESEAQSLRQQLAAVQLQAATAEARAAEIEKRVADLNAELARVAQQNTDLVAALAAAARPPAIEKKGRS